MWKSIHCIFCCLLFVHGFAQGGREPLGKVRSPLLQEISGITPHAHHTGLFWVHNDSGDDAKIYLIDSTCRLLQTVILAGIDVVDVEDIAWLRLDGEPYILLADIGNNTLSRDTLSLYLFKEPLYDQRSEYTVAKQDITVIKFKYADKPRDAEAIFVDPIGQQVYLISKRDFKSQVFSFPLQRTPSQFHMLKPMAELPFNFVTAADISQDGAHIVIKNLLHVFYWRRGEQSIIKTIERKGRQLNYVSEPQGEAICFDRISPHFYTISERHFGLDAYLYRYLLY